MPGHYRTKPPILMRTTSLGGVTPRAWVAWVDASSFFAKCSEGLGLGTGWGYKRMRKYLRAAGYSSTHPALPSHRQVDDSAGEQSGFLRWSFQLAQSFPILQSQQRWGTDESIIQHPFLTTQPTHTCTAPSSVPIWKILLPELSPSPTQTSTSLLSIQDHPLLQSQQFIPQNFKVALTFLVKMRKGTINWLRFFQALSFKGSPTALTQSVMGYPQKA